MPSQDHLVKQLYWFFGLSEDRRKAIGLEGREYVVANYSFDRAAKILEDAVASMEYPDHSLTWLNPLPNKCPMRQNIPENLSNSDFVDWCIINVLGQKEWLGSYWRDELVQGIATGMKRAEGTNQWSSWTRELCWDMMANKAKEANYFDDIRLSMIHKPERKLCEVL